MRIIFLPEVNDDLDDLIDILHKKGYFSFRESSRNYVADLVDNISTTLPRHPHKPAPPYFDKYGKGLFYAAFRKNKQTTWYAFFTKYQDNGNTIYLVRYIANNHSIAQYL